MGSEKCIDDIPKIKCFSRSAGGNRRLCKGGFATSAGNFYFRRMNQLPERHYKLLSDLSPEEFLAVLKTSLQQEAPRWHKWGLSGQGSSFKGTIKGNTFTFSRVPAGPRKNATVQLTGIVIESQQQTEITLHVTMKQEDAGFYRGGLWVLMVLCAALVGWMYVQWEVLGNHSIVPLGCGLLGALMLILWTSQFEYEEMLALKFMRRVGGVRLKKRWRY